jgi:hypothetical protein
MNRWWRAYEEAATDPKLQLLPAELFRTWFNMMCIASRNDGKLPALAHIAYTLQMKVDKAAQALAQLHRAGLLDKTEDGFKPHNWDGRQYKSDRDVSSAERSKRYRDAKRDRHGSVTRDVTDPSRSPETETETETENKHSRSVAKATRPRESHFDEFWEAYPRRDGPNPRKPAEQRFNSLVKSGVDPGTMVEEVKKLAVDEGTRGNIGTRFIPQAITWLNQQRWADHAAVAVMQQSAAAERLSTKVHVKADTPQWRAWAQHLGREPPQDRHFGWSFDSEWPPGHEASVSEASL